MTLPNIPDVVSIDELIKRFENRKKLLESIKTDNLQFDQKASSLRTSLLGKAKEYVKSVSYTAPQLPAAIKQIAAKVVAFPTIPTLPMGFKIPKLPNPPLTNDGGAYMMDVAESTARSAATAIKQKANAIATKIAAAATFPPTGIPVAAVLTVAENLADKLIQDIISSISLPTVDVDAALANPGQFIGVLNGAVAQATVALAAAESAAMQEVAVANAAYTLQKNTMDAATAAAQATATQADATAVSAQGTAVSAQTTAASASAIASQALAAAQQAQATADAALAAASEALNRPIPTLPPPLPPVTITVTQQPIVTPTPAGITPTPVFITPTPAGVTPTLVEITPTPVEITPTPVSITPTPPRMELVQLVTNPLVPFDNATAQFPLPIAVLSGDGLYAIGSSITISASQVRPEYRFMGWYAGGNLIGNNLSVAVVVPDTGLYIVAQFVYIEVTLQPEPGPTVTPTPTPPSGGSGPGGTELEPDPLF